MATEERDTTDALAESAPPDAPTEAEATGPAALQGVYRRLFSEGYLFDFYQAVRLLEKFFPDAPQPGQTSEVRKEQIFFRPETALVFPGTDVKRVELRDADEARALARARLTVTFMGLYGIGSPLPVYFYDELATEEEEVQPLRDFLDIFNHRLYAYFYRAWKKYRPEVHTGTPDEGAHARRFISVTGLGTADTLSGTPVEAPMRLAAFAGRLGPRVRNADGLRALLAGLLGGAAVRILENVPRWVPIPVRPSMGSGGLRMALGTTATVGQRVLDFSGMFRIVVGPLTFEAYQAYLPGKPGARLLAYLVRLYTPDYLDYDVELQLDTSGIPPIRLGDKSVQVGLTTWLGKPADPITSLRLKYD